MSARFIFTGLSISLLAGCTSWSGDAPMMLAAPRMFAENCQDWDKWDKPGPVFGIGDPIHSNTAYVGSCGISILLVHTRDGGAVLIDTAEAKFGEQLETNLRRFRMTPADVDYVLTSHEHFDHVGGLASFVAKSGARVITSRDAKRVLETGQLDRRDPQYSSHDRMEPVPVFRTAQGGDVLTLGGTRFVAIATPGHTPGALSWQWESCGDGPCKSVVYADSLSPVSSDEYRFSEHPEYVAAYRAGLQRLRQVKCDILLTPHPSASNMIERAASGSLEGGMSCTEYADAIEKRLDKRLADEAGAE